MAAAGTALLRHATSDITCHPDELGYFGSLLRNGEPPALEHHDARKDDDLQLVAKEHMVRIGEAACKKLDERSKYLWRNFNGVIGDGFQSTLNFVDL
jgi:hypothetical protein